MGAIENRHFAQRDALLVHSSTSLHNKAACCEFLVERGTRAGLIILPPASGTLAVSAKLAFICPDGGVALSRISGTLR